MQNQKTLKNQKKRNNTYCLIGLGNPGPDYEKSRHNAGFWAVDYIAEKFNTRFKKRFFKNYAEAFILQNNYKIILIKPLTYMNRSGIIIPEIIRRFKLQLMDFFIILDNLDLETGRIKLKMNGNDAGHRGLKSIISVLGTNEFKRIFIGIGRPEKNNDVVAYVLEKISDHEHSEYNPAIEKIFSAVKNLIQGYDLNKIMNELNKR